MTESHLVGKKLVVIERCVHELRTLARPDRIVDDVREQRFVEHTLQIAIQAALDVASHIVSDDHLGEPRTNKDLFELLRAAGWITAELTRPLGAMVGFRNILVHGYEAVDLMVVRDVLENHLGDLDAFVAAIRGRMVGASPPHS